MILNRIKTGLASLLTIFLISSAVAQERVTINVEEFNDINISGGINLVLVQDSSTFIVLEGDNATKDGINYEIKKGRLNISPNAESEMKLGKVYIHKAEFGLIVMNSYGSITNEDVISGKELKLKTSGASEIELELDYIVCKLDLSGASEVDLEGKVDSLFVKSSGASEIKAKDMQNKFAAIDASGASDIYVNPTEKLIADLSGASSLKYDEEPKEKDVNKSGISWGGISKDGEDIEIDVEDIISDKIDGKSKSDFDGNWAGFEIGFNSYMTPDYSFTLDNKDSYFKLDHAKSINFNLNLIETNINLIKNKFGLVTGFGMNWHNYRFENDNMYLSQDSAFLTGGFDLNPNRNYSKSKLNAFYFTVPLILEFQTNDEHNVNSFHISGGVIGGIKISSNTLQVYTNTFDGEVEKTVTSDFYLNPFKLDATARIGWNFINLYANYSLLGMFKKDKGPDIIPVTVGLAIPLW